MFILKFYPRMKCLRAFFSFFHPGMKLHSCLFEGMNSSCDEISYWQKQIYSKIHFTIDRDDFIPEQVYYFYLLLSLKLLSQKKSVLLKLPHLITVLSRLDQSNQIHFAASWWAIIIKGRSNTLFKWHLVKYHFDLHCLPLDC